MGISVKLRANLRNKERPGRLSDLWPDLSRQSPHICQAQGATGATWAGRQAWVGQDVSRPGRRALSFACSGPQTRRAAGEPKASHLWDGAGG